MKHKNIDSYLAFICSKIKVAKLSGSSLCLKNFHPSIIFLLFKHSNLNFVFYFKNGSLDSFSYIFNDFINSGTSMLLPYIDGNDSPKGFRSDNKTNKQASISALFSNLPFRFVLSEQGVENSFFKTL